MRNSIAKFSCFLLAIIGVWLLNWIGPGYPIMSWFSELELVYVTLLVFELSSYDNL